MPKLTDTQRIVLAGAAQRDHRTVLPLPDSLGLNKGAANAVLKSLVKRGFLAERPARHDEEPWREDDAEGRVALIITDAGLDAIGVEPEDAETGDSVKNGKEPAPRAQKLRTKTKQAMLIDLLERKRGATIDEIVAATGWQAHSVRGAISGTLKKKLGLEVESETVAGRGRVYRIAARG